MAGTFVPLPCGCRDAPEALGARGWINTYGIVA
jgi:hypothetical protein